MHVLVAYDIGDDKARSRFFAWLKDRGIHSQLSVFECEMDAAGIECLKQYVRALELDADDSVVIYPLCHRCASQCHVLGRGGLLAASNWLVI